jgi:hypothetical protein
MWILLVSLYALNANQIQSKGVIHTAHLGHEQCLRQRDHVQQTWQLQGYRTSARCIWIKHYSTDNGAYNESNK